jgi:hypothetical protein
MERMAKANTEANASSAGIEALRKNEMMAHLLDALDGGKDIGHYGRLVFTMIARHFLSEEQVVGLLGKDRDFGEDEARALYHQVQGRDYNPPRRDKILEWQAQQDFPILPNADDPDAGNVYRDLTFPEGVYQDIEAYHEQKAEAGQ